MRKIRRIFAGLLLAAVMLTLTGCGNDIEGTWMVTGGTALGAIWPGAEGATLESYGAQATFKFADDGVFSISASGETSSSEAVGTWTVEDGALNITLNGSSIACTYAIDGDSMTMTIPLNGHNVYFTLARK